MVTFKQIIGATCLFGAFIFLRMLLIARERNVRHHVIHLKNGGEERRKLSVFFITDIHRRKIDRKLIRKIRADVDIVIIGGDLAEGGVPLSRIEKNVERLSRLGALFFVWGNNDRELGEQEIRTILEKHHVTILDNENRVIPEHPVWGISGTDDPSWLKVDLPKSLTGIDRYEHVLFVSHQPIVWRKVEAFMTPTIMLAGHTHGGQIRFGKYGIGEIGFFEQTENGAKLISNGYGTSLVPLRFGAHPESHLLTIYYGGTKKTDDFHNLRNR